MWGAGSVLRSPLVTIRDGCHRSQNGRGDASRELGENVANHLEQIRNSDSGNNTRRCSASNQNTLAPADPMPRHDSASNDSRFTKATTQHHHIVSSDRSQTRTTRFLQQRLGAAVRVGGVGFVEIFIGDLVRLGGSTQLGQRDRDGDCFAGRRQDSDGGLAIAQLCADAVTVRLV